MNKYIGQYKIEYEKDYNNKPLIDNTYIVCKKGAEIYRYSPTLLCLYIPSAKRGKTIENKQIKNIDSIEYGDDECRIYFKEEYINIFAKLGVAYTKGKNKAPKKYDKKPNNIKYRVLIDGKVYADNLSSIEKNLMVKHLKDNNICNSIVEKYK